MIFTVEVTTGDHTTGADLKRLAESMRLSIQTDVTRLSSDVFPEFRFWPVAIMPESTGKHSTDHVTAWRERAGDNTVHAFEPPF
jgi:hypothetical protein